MAGGSIKYHNYSFILTSLVMVLPWKCGTDNMYEVQKTILRSSCRYSNATENWAADSSVAKLGGEAGGTNRPNQ